MEDKSSKVVPTREKVKKEKTNNCMICGNTQTGKYFCLNCEKQVNSVEDIIGEKNEKNI